MFYCAMDLYGKLFPSSATLSALLSKHGRANPVQIFAKWNEG